MRIGFSRRTSYCYSSSVHLISTLVFVIAGANGVTLFRGRLYCRRCVGAARLKSVLHTHISQLSARPSHVVTVNGQLGVKTRWTSLAPQKFGSSSRVGPRDELTARRGMFLHDGKNTYKSGPPFSIFLGSYGDLFCLGPTRS